jgi:diketogulonate reductase-like aldo/keto reductase
MKDIKFVIHRVMDDPTVIKLSKELGKSPAQILLRHQERNKLAEIYAVSY